jgi:AcrR family transcriptional regulator
VPRESRTRLRAHERRATIVDSARYLFQRHGFNGATTRAIARRAGVTEAVLYQYFTSKEDLFDETMVRPISGNVESLLTKLSGLAGSISESSDRTLVRERELLTEVVRLVPGIGALFYSEPEVGAALYRDFIAPHFEAATKDLARQRDIGDQKAELLLTLAYGMNLGIALHQRFSDTPMDEDGVVGSLSELIRHGTEGTPPPHAADHPDRRHGSTRP